MTNWVVRKWALPVSVLCAFALVIQSNALAMSILVEVQNPAAGGSAISPDALDKLTAPIALYPDALVAQILMGSTNVAALQQFSGWLAGQNLKGSELQAAAEQAGFDACYIALATFPQVIQMMVQKPDWTGQLGQAFMADKDAVFASIQRLRAKAQAAGNLKTTPQQEVQTQTTSTGQQVIVIQPANPQVVYVPVYNTQTVYVSSPPPPSASSTAATAAVAFTAGIIIGAASTHYYHGPYAWHGASLYHEAWEDRYDYLEDRQENRLDYAEDRQERSQQNQQQRQSTAQANQSQRQSTAQANQSQRQSTAQANQSQRQSTAQGNQAQRQSTAQAGQAQIQANQSASGTQGGRQGQAGASATQASRQGQPSARNGAAATSSYGGLTASQRSGMSSSGLSGYQSGSATRAQSSRGSRSLSSSDSRRGGGGGRRR
jgi:hypothetical protein